MKKEPKKPGLFGDFRDVFQPKPFSSDSDIGFGTSPYFEVGSIPYFEYEEESEKKMNQKFAVGEKVLVLNGHNIPSDIEVFLPDMDDYIGHVYAIKHFDPKDGKYILKTEDGKEYKFVEEWLELAEEDGEYTPEILIKFFNKETPFSVDPHHNRNINIVKKAIERAGGDPIDVKNHVRDWSKKLEDNPDELRRCSVDAFEDCFETIECHKEEVDKSLNILEKAVVQLINKEQSEKIEEAVMSSVEDKVRDFIKSEYGTIERKCVTVVDGKRTEIDGVTHEKFDTVLKFVANDEPVFLTGPAGSGKNFMCKQIAKSLGLDFYFTNAVTQEYKLTGFTDAMGNFQETEFYKAFTQGGLFMLDEIDASIPEVLVILNAAIANRYFDFPAPIGYKEAHPDFRVIAAGNTIGHGADYIYCGRNQLDAASLDRFALVDIDYSPLIERYCANEDESLLKFCRDFRKAAKTTGQNIIVSYRCINRLSKMMKLLNIKEALKTCMLKGIEKDDLNIIIENIPNSEYRKVMKEIAREM